MDADSTKVYRAPSDRDAQLSQLGLRHSDLRDAANFGMRHALACTRHDPPILPGIIAWGKSIRFLRDRLAPLGWEPNNVRNYATIVNAAGTIALATAAGDAWTGRHGPNQHPSTRSPKGPATRDAVGVNQQLNFRDISESFPKVIRVGGAATWLLLFFWDDGAEELRVELSLPADMSNQGYVTRWHERIILDPVPLSGPSDSSKADDQDDDGGPEITVEEIGR